LGDAFFAATATGASKQQVKQFSEMQMSELRIPDDVRHEFGI
jgi:hypothetical protein